MEPARDLPHEPGVPAPEGHAAAPTTAGPYIEVARGRSKRAIRDAGLVLQAAGIAYAVEVGGRGARILVTTADEQDARRELHSYQRENVAWPPEKAAPPPALTDGIPGAIIYGALICAVFWLEHRPTFDPDWRESGVMFAREVRAGEWWRTVTALTLHVDLSHLVSNLIFGCLFGVVAAQTLGTGITWFGTLLAGAGGNAIEVFLVEPTHRAVGASTAIFGTLGLMVAAEWTRRGERRLPWIRRVAPLFAGAVLFGWFGSGGSEPSRVDVLAHATGCLTGAAIGVIVGKGRLTERMGPRSQGTLWALALAVIAGAWALAIAP